MITSRSMALILSTLALPAWATEPTPGHTLSFNAALTSDYIFRGISQSQHDPALSVGADYARSSGLYIGTWLSTQKWVETGPYKGGSDFELDLYGGYKFSVGDIGVDLGMIRYLYDGKRSEAAPGLPTPDTTEAYLGLSLGAFSAKYSRTLSNYFVGWGGSGSAPSTKGSGYLEANYTHDLGDGLSLAAHVGHQKVRNVSVASYTDWKLGVAKDFGFATMTLAYSDTDAEDSAYTWAGEKVGKGIVSLTLSKSF